MSVLETFRLDEKTALVTGGAGLFGRQIVQALAEAGATTWMASRDTAALSRQAKVFAAEGLQIHVAELDQSDEGSVLRLRDRLFGESGGLDVLVNNAVLRPMSRWTDEAEEFARSMAVNATGVFQVILGRTPFQ